MARFSRHATQLNNRCGAFSLLYFDLGSMTLVSSCLRRNWNARGKQELLIRFATSYFPLKRKVYLSLLQSHLESPSPIETCVFLLWAGHRIHHQVRGGPVPVRPGASYEKQHHLDLTSRAVKKTSNYFSFRPCCLFFSE